MYEFKTEAAHFAFQSGIQINNTKKYQSKSMAMCRFTGNSDGAGCRSVVLSGAREWSRQGGIYNCVYAKERRAIRRAVQHQPPHKTNIKSTYCLRFLFTFQIYLPLPNLLFQSEYVSVGLMVLNPCELGRK